MRLALERPTLCGVAGFAWLCRLQHCIALVLSMAVLLFSMPVLSATKVAFIGDQGVSSNARAVLSLIESEGADLLLIQGDLGYHDNTATTWEANLTDVLGADFPVLTVVGNHENHEWPLYKQFIQRRIDRVDNLRCDGDTGVKADCTFGDIQVVQVAPRIFEVEGVSPDDGYADFIRRSFEGSDAAWKVCTWHKNEYQMQVFEKDSQVGWDVYDACLDAGAMVVMGHAHTYSRTHLLSDYETQQVVNRSNEMLLEPGKSFAVVSGLGGHDIKPQVNYGDWFASAYTATQGATHGALFCSMGAEEADCYFKSVDGSVPDSFRLLNGSGRDTISLPPPPHDGPASPIEPESTGDPLALADSSGAVFSRTDKTEYRWIETNSEGLLGSIWISEECAARFGGPTLFGDWHELMALAPGFDTVANPCALAGASHGSVSATGFLFSRTDKEEYRWIDENSSGALGSIWVDQACADSLGEVATTGDWFELMELAPGFDTIANPCY